MWSDPEDIETWSVSQRGAGYVFGSKVTAHFNQLNGLDLICRAHQLVNEGLRYMFPEKSLVTVWSAPNYCYRCGNKASVLSFNENLERFVIVRSWVTLPDSSTCAERSSTLMPTASRPSCVIPLPTTSSELYACRSQLELKRCLQILDPGCLFFPPCTQFTCPWID